MTDSLRRFPMCAILIGAAVAGCANPREDVRLTLCKDMVAVELGAVPSWQGSAVQLRGYQGATVTVRFATADRNQQATCEYAYDAVDDTALILANPIEAYSTSPAKLTINADAVFPKATTECISTVLAPILDPDAVLCSDGAASYRSFATQAKIAHQPSNNPPAKPGAFDREPLKAATGSLTRPRGSWVT